MWLAVIAVYLKSIGTICLMLTFKFLLLNRSKILYARREATTVFLKWCRFTCSVSKNIKWWWYQITYQPKKSFSQTPWLLNPMISLRSVAATRLPRTQKHKQHIHLYHCFLIDISSEKKCLILWPVSDRATQLPISGDLFLRDTIIFCHHEG